MQNITLTAVSKLSLSRIAYASSHKLCGRGESSVDPVLKIAFILSLRPLSLSVTASERIEHQQAQICDLQAQVWVASCCTPRCACAS